MDSITIYDVHRRLKSLSKDQQQNITKINILESNATLSIGKRNPAMILHAMENGNQSSNRIRFETTLALLDALYECGTIGQLRKATNIITEETVQKVRDAKETNTNIKRKLGKLRGKINNRVNKNIEDAQNAIQAKINAAKKNFSANTSQIKTNVQTGLGINNDKDKDQSAKDEAYISSYESIIEALNKCIECDRILENYESISKRFNLEKVIINNTPINGIKDSTNKLCSYIESYNASTAVKFNTVLETMWYGLERYGIKYNRSDIVEAAIDYFCFKENGYKTCIDILRNSSIFNPEDLPSDMQVITELDPKDPDYNVFQRIDQINQEITENYYGKLPTSIYREGADFNKIFADYKKSDQSNKENMLMQLTRKLYTKSVNNIVDGTPAYLNWIRRVGVLGTFAIHPVVGCIAVIGDIFAQLHFEREETEKMQKCFEKEIKESEKKLESSENDEEKERLEKYIESLEKAKDKIDTYYDNMLSDEEIDARYDEDNSDSDEEDDSTKNKSDDDFGMGDDDDDWDDFDEAASLISTAGSAVEKVEDLYDTIGMDTITHINIFNADDIDSLAKLSVEYPDVWSPELMEYTIEKRSNRIRNRKIVFENMIEKYEMLNAYDDAIKTIKENRTYTFKGIDALTNLAECMSAIELIRYTHDNKSIMIEASISNTLKLASEKLKKGFQKLSDKEKSISKSIDINVGNVTKAAERAFENDNREAVIKGSLIPSASKVIKLAITTGALWCVEPAIAVIAALGWIGISKNKQRKERQLIMDEIDTELKMCDEYIDIAKSNNDMQSLKQLYQIQKNLQRQEQKIKYHMKVDFDKDIPNTARN